MLVVVGAWVGVCGWGSGKRAAGDVVFVIE